MAANRRGRNRKQRAVWTRAGECRPGSHCWHSHDAEVGSVHAGCCRCGAGYLLRVDEVERAGGQVELEISAGAFGPDGGRPSEVLRREVEQLLWRFIQHVTPGARRGAGGWSFGEWSQQAWPVA